MRNALAKLSTVGCCALALSGCGGEDAPDKIVIGQAISLSGRHAEGVELTTGPIYDMWVEELNEKGGLFISEYDKRIPVEYIKRDDKSESDVLKKQLEKLMLEDKVDFLLPPWGTQFLHEAAPLANKYGYILMGGAGGAIKLKEIISGLPFFFSLLNHSDTQMPVMADIYEELGVERVAIFFINELHGIEYSSIAIPELARRGIDVVLVRSYEPDEPDKAAVLADTMLEAQELEADAFVGFTYPEATFTAPGVAMGIPYNPKIFHLNVGQNFASFRDTYGPKVVEGMMGPGAWNAKTSNEAAEFEEHFMERWPDLSVDYWGHLIYWAGCQFFEQAIEKAGTLDQDKIRGIMATETFDTALGPMKFENGINVSHPGQMGQWQDGVFEVIGPEDKKTADPIYPKPEWPPPEGEDTGAAGAGGADGGSTDGGAAGAAGAAGAGGDGGGDSTGAGAGGAAGAQ